MERLNFNDFKWFLFEGGFIIIGRFIGVDELFVYDNEGLFY